MSIVVHTLLFNHYNILSSLMNLINELIKIKIFGYIFSIIILIFFSNIKFKVIEKKLILTILLR